MGFIFFGKRDSEKFNRKAKSFNLLLRKFNRYFSEVCPQIKTMKKLSILLVLLIITAFRAQTISGVIVSNDDNQPIPYAKIGIEGEKTGTFSDEKGEFLLDLSGIDAGKNVLISVSGFESFRENVQKFKQKNLQQILLHEKTKLIEEVKINPKKLVEKNWGVNTKTKSVTYNVNPQFNKESFLGETALEFKTKKRAKIKNINLNIAEFNSSKPIVLRYAIYNDENNRPGKSLLEEEITVELSENQIKDGVFTFDLNDQNIWVEGKFYVGIQFLKAFEGNVRISAALFKTGYMRQFYGDWEKVSIAAPAINIDVKVEK